jgi:hypothetical protein
MSNKIPIYQHNSHTVGCYINTTLDISTYTPYLTIKKSAADVEPILSKTGMLTGEKTATFDLLPIDTSMLPGDYVYDITIENGVNVYTVLKDRLSIIDTVRN